MTLLLKNNLQSIKYYGTLLKYNKSVAPVAQTYEKIM